MRIGTKYFLGLSFNQVGLQFLTLWRFRSTPPLSRLWIRLLRHPALPPVHQLLLVRTSLYLLWSFIYIYICYADHMDWSALKYRRLRLFASLLWCGAWSDTSGGKLALRAGGRRQMRHLFRVEKIDRWGSNWPLGAKMCFFDPKIWIFGAKSVSFVW